MHFSNFCEHFEARLVIPFQLRVGREDKDREWTRMEGKMIPGPSRPRLTGQGHLSGQCSSTLSTAPDVSLGACEGALGPGAHAQRQCGQHQAQSSFASHPPSGQLSLLPLNEGCTHDLYTAAAAKSPQSCPTLCDPTDGSPPDSPIPGILQARTPEWVAISFSNA